MKIAKKIVFALIPLVLIILALELAGRFAAGHMLSSRKAQLVNNQNTIIACYGDSWTYGLGVAERAAYPTALQRALELSGIKDVTVINRGQPGAGINNVSKLVRADLIKSPLPNIIVILVGNNDVQTATHLARANSLPSKSMTRRKTPFAYRLLRELVLHIRHQHFPKCEKTKSGMSVITFEGQLQSLLADIIRHEIRPLVLSYPLPVHPLKPQLFLRNGFDVLTTAQYRAAHSLDVRFLDLQPAFDNHPGDAVWLNSYYTHPNELGYALMAATMLPAIADLLGKKVAADLRHEKLLAITNPSDVRWPETALFSKKPVDYSVNRSDTGQKVIEADTDENGETDYWALYEGEELIRLTRIYPDNPSIFTYEYQHGVLVGCTIVHQNGSRSLIGYERIDQATLIAHDYQDKDKDGVYDHYEQLINGVLVQRQDDNDQDGRWELWALIDENGHDFMHLGDHDGDGRIDYWEVRHENEVVFHSRDEDRDGRPDQPLPPPEQLGLTQYRPEVLRHWRD